MLFKPLISFFISIALFFSSVPISFSTQIDELEPKMKAVVLKMNNTGSTHLDLWLQDVDHAAIEKKAYELTGLTEDSITGDLDLDTINNYSKVKSELYREAFSKQNADFAKKLSQYSDTKIVYQSVYSPLATISTTKESAEKILLDQTICEAYINIDSEIQLCSSVINQNTGVTALRDVSGIGADGEGIIIGQIELGCPNVNLSYNSQNYFDANKVTALPTTNYSPTNENTKHANLVAAIMVGQPVTYGGKTYKGIAPEAELIAINTTWYNLTYAIEQLIQREVRIINCSFATYNSNGIYSNCPLAKYIDYIIYTQKIHFVAGAGNKFYNDISGQECDKISDFALAYNCICVGNLNDNNALIGSYAPASLSYQILNANFNIASDSSYATGDSSHLKPDLACFGTGVEYGNIFISENNASANTGTSFAAPQISGMIALLCSEYPELTRKPEMVKAILAATAVYRANNTNTLDTKNLMSEMFDRQGAGIANVKCAYQTCLAGKKREMTISGNVSSTSLTINVPASYTYLRLAVTWDNKVTSTSEDFDIANIDIAVYYNNQFIVASENANSNIELLQFPVTQGGNYKIYIYNRTYQEYGVNLGQQNLNIAWY